MHLKTRILGPLAALVLMLLTSAPSAYRSTAAARHNIDVCSLYGAVYVEEVESFAKYRVFVEDVEAFSDLVVFKEQAQSFADRNGMWYFTDVRAFADFTVAFTDVKGFADFSVYFTEFKTTAGCRK
jgi:hypothetical protein